MPKKAIAPQPEIARQHQKSRITPTIANNFQVADLDQQRLGLRLAAYQDKLTQDYHRAIDAADWGDARAEALNDLFADLEEFETDGGVYAPID